MINLGNYRRTDEPVITRVKRNDSTYLAYIGKTNGCDRYSEPWKHLTWSRSYEHGKPLPKEFTGKLPSDANMLDTFLWSMYDQATVEQILKDAKKDPHIKMMLDLRKEEQKLWDERFPPMVEP